VTLKGQGRDPICLELLSRKWLEIETRSIQEMAPGASNGHIPNDIM